jgi:hypothetical protein
LFAIGLQQAGFRLFGGAVKSGLFASSCTLTCMNDLTERLEALEKKLGQVKDFL